MKTPLALLFIALLMLASCTQDGPEPATPTAPPNAVVNAFKVAHGTIATYTGWEMEGDDVELEYLVNGQEVSELYDTKGNLISTESRIEPADLPQAVRDAVAADAPDGTIEAAEQIVSTDETVYEVVVRSGTEVRELLYSADGFPMGEESDEEEDGVEADDDEAKP